MESKTDIAEQQWLAALREGDESALRAIFNRHYPRLLSDIYRLIPDEDTCKDLAQEVFVELWRKRAALDIHTSLRAYLRRAAVNRALNHLKTSKKILLEQPDERHYEPFDHAGEQQVRERQESMEQALAEAIAGLPEKCRLVFTLSRFENLSHREIAEQLGISVKTIENQITKAMRMLRDALMKHGNLSPVVILWLFGY